MDLVLILFIFLIALTPGLFCDYISGRVHTKKESNKA